MHRVVIHTKQMLLDRGYIVKKKLNLSSENGPYYKENDNSSQDTLYEKAADKINVYLARYIAKEKFKVENFNIPKKDAKLLSNEILKHIVVNIEPKTKGIVIFPENLLESIGTEFLSERITIFSEIDLHFNPTKNILVPKHVKATEDDMKMLQYKKIANQDLPVILKSDPICKWYGFEEGDIVRVERDYCNDIYYRLVVKEEKKV
jgi:DNA-directed RNA polymerase subunit H (RpoH/RPB5)